MKFSKVAMLMVSGALFALSGPLYALDKEETQLQKEHQRLDSEPPEANDSDRVNQLAKQYNVEPQTVQDLRNKGQGWGEVTIGLATAQELQKTNPQTYPTYADALNKVQSMRSDGAGWGKIAKDLGFKLGPVVSDAQHARNDMRHPPKPESVQTGKPEKMDKPGHPDNMGKPDHAGRPDHPEKPPKPNK